MSELVTISIRKKHNSDPMKKSHTKLFLLDK